MDHLIGFAVAITLFAGVIGVIVFVVSRIEKKTLAENKAWRDKHNYVQADPDTPGQFLWENHPQRAGRDNGKKAKLALTGQVKGIPFFIQGEFLGMKRMKSKSNRPRYYEAWEPVMYFPLALKNIDRIEIDHTATMELTVNVPDLPEVLGMDLNNHWLVEGLDKDRHRGYRVLATWPSQTAMCKWEYRTWGNTDDWAQYFYKTGIVNQIIGQKLQYPFVFGFIDNYFFIRLGNIDHSHATYDYLLNVGASVVHRISELTAGKAEQSC